MAWYETFFDEHYLKEYEKGLTLERAQKEESFSAQKCSTAQVLC